MLRALGAAAAAFVPLVLVANAAVLATPHARGIGFVTELRYAILTPLCAAFAGGAALLYGVLAARSDHPGSSLTAVLVATAGVGLVLMDRFGPRGLLAAGAPAVLVSALTLAALVPHFFGQPPGVGGIGALALLGALEVVGAVAARAGERTGPSGPDGLTFDVPRSLFDVDHRFADLRSGARVHYVDEGAGPTLLFLHGNPAWSFQWRDLIVGLRGRFRCVALDYPGFGMSRAPAGYGFTAREQSLVVEELVDHLGLRDVTLVMQDWGGPIGLGMAGRRPELVRAVVLGSTWAWPTSTREPRGKFSLIAGGPIGEFAQMNFNAFAAFGLSHGVLRTLPADVTATYLRPFRPVHGRGVAAFYPGQITAGTAYLTEVEEGLARLADRRALLFWGMRDQGFPRPDLERFQRAFPAHETIEVDADHFFFEDTGPQFVAAIAAFAAR